MEYAEALKKVQSKKPRDNYMVVTLAYDLKVILPYKDGITFINSLVNAEQFNEPYGKRHSVTELESKRIQAHLMSCDEYERYKIAALLDISVEEAKEAGLQLT